ncbi:hypothetical protein BEL04_03945 [Mucilaginibacter sp. PPCGB 2223]|uniref:hypothetical protein n=1 Tax=Mucilaginibacter sp. PPCGB 2223 TaxID=1886027 RepID=UPI0008252287|nr:hypothetical protein [Mucilaginibacter sp. PPCGB 2223]OCX53463.1 hypothetical protein BEL04_03945 [Mucilaginibacter sp. PPCGB 2223]
METRTNRDDEIEAILNSLDGAGRAEVSPFFYTRVEARLQQQKNQVSTDFLQRLVSRPVLAVSVLTVFLVFNIMAIRGLSSVNNSVSTSSASALQNFAADYNMNTTVLYNNSER